MANPNYVKGLITQLANNAERLGRARATYGHGASPDQRIDDAENAVNHATRKLHEVLGLAESVPQDVMFWLDRVGTEVEVKLAHQPGWTRATVLDAFTVTTEKHFYGRTFRPLETVVQLMSTSAVLRKPSIFRRPSELRLVFENELTPLPTMS